MLNDTQRAALMVLIANVVTALVLFAVVDWSGEQVAIVNAVVNSGLIAVAKCVPAKGPV